MDRVAFAFWPSSKVHAGSDTTTQAVPNLERGSETRSVVSHASSSVAAHAAVNARARGRDKCNCLRDKREYACLGGVGWARQLNVSLARRLG